MNIYELRRPPTLPHISELSREALDQMREVAAGMLDVLRLHLDTWQQALDEVEAELRRREEAEL